MNIEKLKQQRESIKAKLSAIDAKIAKAERAARDAEQRELVKLIQSRGISVARLSQMLDAGGGVEGEAK